MRVEEIWKVRDARRLNHKEKLFLMVLISRGEEGMFGKWHRNATDMGMSKDMYYNTRNALVTVGVIKAERRYDSTTVYTFDSDGLSRYENEDSEYEKGDSQDANVHSHQTETKENSKKNMKGNQKENVTTVASAPVVTEQSISPEDGQPPLTLRDKSPAFNWDDLLIEAKAAPVPAGRVRRSMYEGQQDEW